jgi:hypothetical protein
MPLPVEALPVEPLPGGAGDGLEGVLGEPEVAAVSDGAAEQPAPTSEQTPAHAQKPALNERERWRNFIDSSGRREKCLYPL